MHARPRIDLDGVPLADPKHPDMVLAIFRYRTTAGLVLLIPESADLTIEWANVTIADLDLESGEVELQFKPDWAKGQNWLRGTTTIVGLWIDRYQRT